MSEPRKPKLYWCVRRPNLTERICCDTREEAEKYYEGFNSISVVVDRESFDELQQELAQAKAQADYLLDLLAMIERNTPDENLKAIIIPVVAKYRSGK